MKGEKRKKYDGGKEKEVEKEEEKEKERDKRGE